MDGIALLEGTLAPTLNIKPKNMFSSRLES